MEEQWNEGIQDMPQGTVLPRQKIRGWLLFFLILLGIGGLLRLYGDFYLTSLSYHLGILANKTKLIEAIIDAVETLAIVGLSIYTIVSFVKNKPNSVSLARFYLISGLMTGLFLLVPEISEPIDYSALSRIIRSLIMSCIWLAFFSYSKQVERLFPKKSRKTKNIDILIFLLTWIPGYLFFLINSI